MSVAIIDYGSGNLRSVAKAFEHVGGNAQSIRVVKDAAALNDASHIVLPGVGAFADCMRGLSALPGTLDAIQEAVCVRGRHFLGVCVGMQMLFERGHEYGTHQGLGWLAGDVVPLSPQNPDLKVPHMGWNELQITGDHPLFKNVANGAHAYFVHSYCAKASHPADVIATTQYGQTITAVVARDNIMGTQFHPEKSQETGLRLIRNFLDL